MDPFRLIPNPKLYIEYQGNIKRLFFSQSNMLFFYRCTIWLPASVKLALVISNYKLSMIPGPDDVQSFATIELENSHGVRHVVQININNVSRKIKVQKQTVMLIVNI